MTEEQPKYFFLCLMLFPLLVVHISLGIVLLFHYLHLKALRTKRKAKDDE